MTETKVAVVIALYNEEAIITELAAEIEKHIQHPLVFVFVDDGSTDRTLDMLRSYAMVKAENRKRIVVLSRNFGHHQAIMAGLFSVPEDAGLIVVMDGDFQDNPGDIPAMMCKMAEGYDCVYAERTANSDCFIVDMMTRAFYKIQKSLFSFRLPENSGTFSVFNRSVLVNLLKFKESEIYFPGLRAYVGMRQVAHPVIRRNRAHGKSRVGFLGLINLAMSGILGFTAVPMRLIFMFGLLTTMLCMFLGFVVFLLKVLGITQIPGITTLLIVILGFFGIQIMFTGAVGEYVGKMFLESKNRPRWFVREIVDEE